MKTQQQEGNFWGRGGTGSSGAALLTGSRGRLALGLQRQASGCRRDGAFTLIEILVVFTLLVLLAGIALPNYFEARKESQKSSCINNIKQINYAIEEWAIEKKKSPNSEVVFDDISPFLKGSVVCPAGGKSFYDSYLITVVANEPVCQRQPKTHLWFGSTAIAAVQASQAKGGSGGLAGNNGGDKISAGKGKGIGKGGVR